MRQVSSRWSKNAAAKMVSSYFTGMNSFMLSCQLADCKKLLPAELDSLTDREIYNWLMKRYYHNEAYVKSAFIKKHLLNGNHVAIFEYPVQGSRTDLVKVNGTTEVFEIKTAYDSLSRLGKQLSDYSRVFDKVCVVCCKEKYEKVLASAPAWVGIFVYYDGPSSCAFSCLRHPQKSPLISSNARLGCLSQEELRNAFHCDCDKETIVSHYASRLSEKRVSAIFRDALKKRYAPNWDFLRLNIHSILEIDYQWFFKTMMAPELVYGFKTKHESKRPEMRPIPN